MHFLSRYQKIPQGGNNEFIVRIQYTPIRYQKCPETGNVQ